MSLKSFVRNGLVTKISRNCSKNIPLLVPPQNDHLSIVGAGASLYLASQKNGHKLRQFEIADAFGITDGGLRVVLKRMKKMREENDKLLLN